MFEDFARAALAISHAIKVAGGKEEDLKRAQINLPGAVFDRMVDDAGKWTTERRRSVSMRRGDQSVHIYGVNFVRTPL